MKMAHTYFDICLDFIYLGGFLRPSLLGVFVKTHNSLCISRNIQFFPIRKISRFCNVSNLIISAHSLVDPFLSLPLSSKP